MRILIDGRGINKTGIGRYIHNTLRELLLIDKKNDYELLIRPEDRAGLKLSAPNLELVDADAKWFGAKEQTALINIINTRKPDLVHFTNFNFPVAYKGKFVITIHDLTLLHFKNLRSSVAERMYYLLKEQIMRNVVLKQGIGRARAVLVPTEYVKEDVVKTFRVRRNKVVTTHEAVGKDFAPPRFNLPKAGINKPFLLYIGNAYPHKNLERMIMAFGRLITKYMLDYQLVIAGKKDSFHNALEQAVVEAKLQDRVVFTGYVTDAQLASLYNSASLYVFPSLSEGFGLPPLEAMAHGLPVASSKATCLPEVLGDAAVYFDPKSIASMSRVMLSVLTDPKLSSKLTKLGYRQVKKYSWKKTAQETLDVYERVLRNYT